jgi:CRISPR/Cas system-associated exonuclease Cas4 (RecB family)
MAGFYFFRVSEVGRCLRFLYFSRVIGRLEDVGSKPEVIASKNMHVEFQNDYAAIDETAKMEKEVMFVHENFIIVGKADIITEEKVIEIKTVKNLPEKPYPPHLRQINFYMKLCGREKGSLIYIKRETKEQKTFSVDYDEDLFLEDLKRFEKLTKHLETTTVPEKERTKMCEFCEYKELCEKIKQ